MFQYLKFTNLGGGGIPSVELVVSDVQITRVTGQEVREGPVPPQLVSGPAYVENVVPYNLGDGVTRDVRLLVPETHSGYAPSPAAIRGAVQRLAGDALYNVDNWPASEG